MEKEKGPATRKRGSDGSVRCTLSGPCFVVSCKKPKSVSTVGPSSKTDMIECLSERRKNKSLQQNLEGLWGVSD